jgi:FkbM family methyltransferase
LYVRKVAARKVFIDVGAHVGESLVIAQQPRWGFTHLYSFEPAPNCWPILGQLADHRTAVLQFGLWSTDAELELYDPGAIGASLFEGKSLSGASIPVDLRDAAEWFAANIDRDDEVVMKINCEGAECEVLDRLLSAGELSKVDHLVVHFDVRKVPGMADLEAPLRSRMTRAGIPYHAADDMLIGRNISEKTANWLEWYHASRFGRMRHTLLRRAEFAGRIRVYEWRASRAPRAGRPTT